MRESRGTAAAPSPGVALDAAPGAQPRRDLIVPTRGGVFIARRETTTRAGVTYVVSMRESRGTAVAPSPGVAARRRGWRNLAPSLGLVVDERCRGFRVLEHEPCVGTLVGRDRHRGHCGTARATLCERLALGAARADAGWGEALTGHVSRAT